MTVNKRKMRNYLGIIAEDYAEEADDKSLRVDIVRDFDRMLNGLPPINPFYAWDALGRLRLTFIPESDPDARQVAEDLYATAEKHFMEEAQACRPMSTNAKMDPLLK